MAVPEQIPYVGYLGNGTSTEFPITFDLHDQDYLVVTLNKEIPVVGAYSVDMNAMKVVFATAPKQGDQIELYRDTQLNRDTNYKSYDNSFRPETVNWDFDTIWHVLQEQHMVDAELLARIKQEIEWRRTHDANFDELAKMRDAQVFSGLKQYLDTIIASTDPNIFGGVTAGIVFALDQKSVQTHLELIYQELTNVRTNIESEELRATQAENLIQFNLSNEIGRSTNAELNLQNQTSELQAQVNAIGVGNKAYLTYVAMDADRVNIPVNSKVTVTNDATSTNNGDWQWNGTVFTKSVFDPIPQAVAQATAASNAYTDDQLQELYDLSEALTEFDVSFGSLDTTGATSNNVPSGTYVLNQAAERDAVIRKISFVSKFAVGVAKIKIFTLASGTFTLARTPIELTVTHVGLNEFDNLDIVLGLGEYLAFSVVSAGVVAYINQTTPAPTYYTNSNPDATSFANTAPGSTAILQIEYLPYPDLTNMARVLKDFDERIDANTELLGHVVGNQRFGIQQKPAAAATQMGLAQFVTGRVATKSGRVTKYYTYANVAGKVQVGAYIKSGTSFTRQRYVEVDVVVGLNIIDVDFAVNIGEYLGMRSSVAGQCTYISTTLGHDGTYSTTSLADTATYSSPVNTGVAFQFGFDQIYSELDSGSGSSGANHWSGQTLATFGDSITWYDGQTFAQTHLEAGTACKGYQSWVREALGCLIDNHGQSGWDMTQIYSSKINTFNFANTYATTITSGANDARKGVPIGVVAEIGSLFNTATYAGALQASIERVIASNPACKIFLITPIRGWYNEYNTTDVPNTDPSVVGLMSESYVNIMKDIGKLYGIPVLDWFNDTGFNNLNKAFYYGDSANSPTPFTAYVLHPKNIGFKRMGEILAGFLSSN